MKNDKRDQNDSKTDQKLRVTSKRNSAIGTDDVKNLTGRANSSLNSRQANPPTIPPAAGYDTQTPQRSTHRSRISVRLQDKLLGQNDSVRSSLTDGNGKLTLKVKGQKRVKSRSGQKSPTNNNRYDDDRSFARRIAE